MKVDVVLKRIAICAAWGGLIFPVAGETLDGVVPSFAPPEAAETSAWQRVTSSSRRVIVSGRSLSETADMASAAEDVLNRIEQLLGFSIPFSRMDPIRIGLDHDPAIASGMIFRAEGWADRQLIQRLFVQNPERLDQEELLEELCRLACARPVIFLQEPTEREQSLGRAPDWLAVGVAQNLYSALRVRNAEILVQAWESARELSLSEVLELDWLPPGRWGEKAAAGVAVGLLASQTDRAALFRDLFRYSVRGAPVTPGVLSAVDPLGRSPTEWEKEWDVWVAAQSRVIRVGKADVAQRLKAVRNEMEIRPLDLGMPENPSLPSVLSPHELIERRYERWASPLAMLLAFRVRALGIGQPQAVWDVTHAYANFFEAVAAARSDGWLRRLWRRAEGGRILRDKLAVAEDILQKTERTIDDERLSVQHVLKPGTERDIEMQRFLPREERLRWAEHIKREAHVIRSRRLE